MLNSRAGYCKSLPRNGIRRHCLENGVFMQPAITWEPGWGCPASRSRQGPVGGFLKNTHTTPLLYGQIFYFHYTINQQEWQFLA